MNAIKLATAAAVALGTVSTGQALADQNEIIAIYNSAENDSDFAMLSYRRSLGPSLDEGLILRLDASRGMFDLPGSEGTIDTLRLLLGYRVQMSVATDLAFYGGPSMRERSYSPVLPGLTEFDDVGLFLSAEYNVDLATAEGFALVEFDTTEDLFYTMAFYQFDFGGFKIGPTANYLSEGDYERHAAGVRLTIPIGDAVDFTATGAWAEGNTGGANIDSSYIELQFRTRF